MPTPTERYAALVTVVKQLRSELDEKLATQTRVNKEIIHQSRELNLKLYELGQLAKHCPTETNNYTTRSNYELTHA